MLILVEDILRDAAWQADQTIQFQCDCKRRKYNSYRNEMRVHNHLVARSVDYSLKIQAMGVKCVPH